jgi:hypothetical protein
VRPELLNHLATCCNVKQLGSEIIPEQRRKFS